MTSAGRGGERALSRRSTLAGLGGILLVAVGVVLTLTGTGGDVVPTVLAFVGVGSLMAGIISAAMQVAGSLRYGRNAPASEPGAKEDDDFYYRQAAPLHHIDPTDPN